MMKQEFEKLAGYEVSSDDYYNIIEPMYSALTIDKSEFVKFVNPKQFALKTEKQLIAEARKAVKTFNNSKDWDKQQEALEKLNKIRYEYRERLNDGNDVFLEDEHNKFTGFGVYYGKYLEYKFIKLA